MLNVCVIGTGYVGLVTGTCLAQMGHSVVCVDTDRAKIDNLRGGRIPIYEPGLERLVASNVTEERLRFATDVAEAIASETLVLFLAVGTPTSANGATASLGALFEAAADALRHRRDAGSKGFLVLVIKSTVPVGTCARIEALAARYLPKDSFAVVSNPEFLREGCAMDDFLVPDRIVAGSSSLRGLAVMSRLYEPLTSHGHQLLALSSIETAEMIKYASNVFLATKIGLINEFSRFCEATGADVEQLSVAVGLDRRIGPSGLRAGPGFGGSCFPKDLRAVVHSAAEAGSRMPIAEAVIVSNEEQKRAVVARIVDGLDGDVRNLRIAVLGLSFKAGTDDVREAPPLSIIEALQEAGAFVTAFDPVAIRNARRILPTVEFADSAEEAIADCDAVVLATEWPEFRAIDWKALRPQMARPLIFDLRNHLDARLLVDLGFEYVGLGRPAIGGRRRERTEAARTETVTSIAAE